MVVEVEGGRSRDSTVNREEITASRGEKLKRLRSLKSDKAEE